MPRKLKATKQKGGFMGNLFGKANTQSENNNQQLAMVEKDLDLESSKKGAPGSNYIVIFLKSGEKVLSSPSSLIYMKGDVEKGEIEIGKDVLSAFSRSFAGEDMFMTSYKGGQAGGHVAFSSDIPGDVIKVQLKKDEEYTISRTSFLCSTENISISATVQPLGILGIGSGEGFILPKIKANSGGSIWLATFGSFERIDLLPNEEIILDNGVFLAAPSHMNYTLVRLGKTFISSFLGGEGFGMKFVGPGTIYTQSKNLNNFGQMMSKYVGSVDKPQTFKGAVKGAVVGAVANAIFGDDAGDGIGEGIGDALAFEGGKRTKKTRVSRSKPKSKN